VTGTTSFQAALDSAQKPAADGYPLAVRGRLIGFPYQGSHTLYGNWESDNAVDISVPTGTPVYAVTDGVIGSQIGALDSSDPHLQGLRVHLDGASNDYYYAHLSRLVVTAGEQVHKGDLIGYSGSANGVEHLHFAVRDGSPLSIVS
jgi:murein DD-endopeptidase MepM/ murein hydrolase activator NlpD